MYLNLENFVLITGASSGFGRATAEKLAAQGKNLILVARRLEKLEALKIELESAHSVDVRVYSLDVSDMSAVEDFFAQILDLPIDILINNAGLSRGKEPFEACDFSDWEEMINTNVRGLLKVTQLAIPVLKETQGHIVNLSSIAGIEAYEGGNVYGGTKSFVRLISQSLRIDLLGSGIRVTDIAPGAANTEFSAVRFKGDQAKADSVYEGFEPLRGEDIADAIFYCVTAPSHVNVAQLVLYPTAQASPRIFFRD